MPQVDIKLVSVADISGFTAVERAGVAMDQGLKKASAAASNMQNAVNSFGMSNQRVMQAAGYQVQDFIVQVAGGQKALVALSQQGSQFLGVFGPGGAIAGAVLAIGSMAAQFLLMNQHVDEMAKSWDKMVARSKEFNFGLLGPQQQIASLKSDLAKLEAEYVQLATDPKKMTGSREVRDPTNKVTGMRIERMLSDKDVDGLVKKQEEIAVVAEKLGKLEADAADLAKKAAAEKTKAAEKESEELDEAINRANIYAALQEEDAKKLAAERAKKQIADDKELATTKAIRDEQAALENRQIEINQKLAELDSDFTKTEAEKWATQKQLRQDAVDAAKSYLEVMRQIRANASTEEGKRAADNGVRGAVKDVGAASVALAGNTADPNSVLDQIAVRMTAIQNQWGTMAQQMADLFTSSFTNAANSISSALDGFFQGTVSKGHILQQIGIGFGQSMLKSVADFAGKFVVTLAMMPIKWLATKAEMFAIDAAFAAKGLLLSAANAAKSLIMWIPSAIAASISSWGAAAALGAAAVGVALVASKGFEAGGFTGPGGKNQVAGVVHGNEWVAPAWMLGNPLTADVIANLEHFRTGGGIPQITMPDSYSGGSGSRSSGGGDSQQPDIVHNMAFFDSQRDAERWARSQEGRNVIVDIVRKHALHV